jgi:hypothetical protein
MESAQLIKERSAFLAKANGAEYSLRSTSFMGILLAQDE